MVGFIHLTVLSLTASAFGRPSRRATNMVVHESRDGVPAGFASAKTALSSDSTITLRIALTPADIKGLEATLYDVSTPGSEKYGQYLSKAEVAAFAQPKSSTSSAVTWWLISSGVPTSSIRTTGTFSDWLSVTLPIEDANSLLDTTFSTYIHEASGEHVIRTLEYSLPEDLFAHIEAVHPTTSFARVAGGPQFEAIVDIPVVEKKKKRDSDLEGRAFSAPASCSSTITPACLQALYAIPTTPATQASNELGVTGFIDQWANEADLRSFLAALRPDMNSSTTFKLETLDGGQNPQGTSQAGVEANLDIQYTVGIATGVPVTFISVGSDNTDGVSGFMDVFDSLAAEEAPPAVISTSYGFNEPELGSALATRMCNGYMALGARGVSVLFASGDGGVSGVQSQSCTTFIPEFPASCPFQTAIGGTTGVTEVVATFSGGGFSNYFTQPDYQVDVVSSYITNLGTTYAGRYNTTGRGFPDISAQAQRINIFYQGRSGTVSGTSASTPIMASIVSLLNDMLVAAGKPVLGFLNPFLYANPQAFFDITSGSNPGCSTTGFAASTGWDPVTGLGTPNFPALVTAVGL